MTLIRRQPTETGFREAIYSDCERYRYALTAVWDTAKPRLLYIMLNPSKATELNNDPTIERCERRSYLLGYGAFRVVNLFGLRETSPARLKKDARPCGPSNAKHIMEALSWTDDILAAWGVHGMHRDQARHALADLECSGRPILCLGTTKDGHPRHPLYVSYKVKPRPF